MISWYYRHPKCKPCYYFQRGFCKGNEECRCNHCSANQVKQCEKCDKRFYLNYFWEFCQTSFCEHCTVKEWSIYLILFCISGRFNNNNNIIVLVVLDSTKIFHCSIKVQQCEKCYKRFYLNYFWEFCQKSFCEHCTVKKWSISLII